MRVPSQNLGIDLGKIKDLDKSKDLELSQQLNEPEEFVFSGLTNHHGAAVADDFDVGTDKIILEYSNLVEWIQISQDLKQAAYDYLQDRTETWNLEIIDLQLHVDFDTIAHSKYADPYSGANQLINDVFDLERADDYVNPFESGGTFG